jgi:predicted ATP-grasp superfamily ATP-dependent carboligase
MPIPDPYTLERKKMLSYSQDKIKPYAIIIGLDHINGIQTARILAHHEVPLIGIAKDPKHYCCRTKVCDEILFADTSNEEFIRTLENLGPSLNRKAVLIPCTDMNVLLVSRHRQRLEKYYHVVLPAEDIVEMMMDKVSFYTYAQKEGIPIPPTFFLKSREDAEKASEQLIFPCVLKPPISSTSEWEQNSKLKAYRVSNARELLTVYDHVKQWAELLIVQQWIEGPITNLYSCNCYFSADSEPLVTFVARKIRQWPPETGESCLGEECRNDVVLDETNRLFQNVNYRGLGYVEMKLDERTGKHYILEPNVGRPTGRSAIAEGGGVELIYTMYLDSIGWPLPANLEQIYNGVKWICLRRDFQSALYYWRKKELTIKDWWLSLQGRKTYALFSWTDPGPFIGDILRSIRLFLSREERKKRNYDEPLL